jgi:PPK2 family polyphosphate:nucleotide phosphotransferase
MVGGDAGRGSGRGYPDRAWLADRVTAMSGCAMPRPPHVSTSGARPSGPVAAALTLPDGPVELDSIPTRATPVGPRSKEHAEREMAALGPRLADWQERLYAAGTAGDRRRVLLLLQGMDTAGKDGVINHVINQVDPGGVHLAAFKQPTAQELAHDFLWRIEKQVPAAGMIGVFNRSQYEDVLVVRVHDLVPRSVWGKRYAAINAFERKLARSGVTVVKCFLHVSRDEQRERLMARLADPSKYWKFNPGDIDERALWDDYQAAYADALRRCHTTAAPWYVIPADRKWYRNWAVAALLGEALEAIDPQYPPADFDVDVERRRLASS